MIDVNKFPYTDETCMYTYTHSLSLFLCVFMYDDVAPVHTWTHHHHRSGRHVIVIDDIIDSGKTMEAVLGALSGAGCASISCCCLLSKQARRISTPERCLVGFEIEDAFVIGYGLDFDEAWRHLPYIAVMSPR